jgi:ATP synthase protein I
VAEEPEGARSWGSAAGPFLTLGIQLALTVVVFFFLGRWLDDRFGTAPWLMRGGLALGVTGGMISFFRTVIALGRKEAAEAEERRKETPREA